MTPPEGMSASVLIADDDALVRGVLRLVLTRAGYTVAEASDAQEAVAVAHAHRFDLVVLDINMPGGSVHDTVNSLRNQRPELPILVLSGELEPPRELAGIPFDFARKPIGRVELLTLVENLLDNGSSGP